MNEIIKKSKGNKPLGRTKTVETRIADIVNRYTNGATKEEIKTYVMTEFKVAEQQFSIYWRWLQDEYALTVGNKEERIQDHLNDLDQLYRDAVSAKETTKALRIKKFIMVLEGTYVPHQKSLFASFDFDSIELKIIGQQKNSKTDNSDTDYCDVDKTMSDSLEAQRGKDNNTEDTKE